MTFFLHYTTWYEGGTYQSFLTATFMPAIPLKPFNIIMVNLRWIFLWFCSHLWRRLIRTGNIHGKMKPLKGVAYQLKFFFLKKRIIYEEVTFLYCFLRLQMTSSCLNHLGCESKCICVAQIDTERWKGKLLLWGNVLSSPPPHLASPFLVSFSRFSSLPSTHVIMHIRFHSPWGKHCIYMFGFFKSLCCVNLNKM